MEISVLYKQGTARVPEDGIIFQPPFYFGAVDGTSGIYLPEEGPRLFDGRTGGQIAARAISNATGLATSDDSLKKILLQASREVQTIAEINKISLWRSELLPSASFCLSKITPNQVTIIQGGDSLAIWKLNDGTLSGTPNLAFNYERYLLDTIEALMEKHDGNRSKMWQEFRPILKRQRQDHINMQQGGFAILNGQSEFQNFWQVFHFSPQELELLILCSDGLVPFDLTKNPTELANVIVPQYEKDGLEEILYQTREVNEERKHKSHEDKPEATAVAIEF